MHRYLVVQLIVISQQGLADWVVPSERVNSNVTIRAGQSSQTAAGTGFSVRCQQAVMRRDIEACAGALPCREGRRKRRPCFPACAPPAMLQE